MKTLLLVAALVLIPLQVQGSEIDKASWIDKTAEELPAAMCREENFYRTCFRVDEKQCMGMASKAVSKCLDKYRDDIPATLNEQRDGTRWGAKVASCSGANYEKKYVGKRIRNDSCAYNSDWQ